MTDLANRKPILCLDFDGVAHSYTSGWKGAAVIPDPPVPGLFDFLLKAALHFEIHIFSSRSGQEGGINAMKAWFAQHLSMWASLPPDAAAKQIETLLHFPTEKPPAFLGIDDRVLTFKGKWPTIETMSKFKPWNAKER